MSLLETYSSLLNTFFVSGIFLYCLYKYLTYNHKHWFNLGIPYKEPKLFFGNYANVALMKENLGDLCSELYNKFYNEKIVGVFRFSKLEVMVCDPDLIKCVLVKDFNHFYNRDKDHNGRHEALLANLFTAKGNHWSTTRHKLTPLFSSGKLRSMFPLILEKGKEFQEFLSTTLNFEEIQEVTSLMANFPIAVIGSCAFGLKLNSMSDDDDEFRRMGRMFFKPSTRTRVMFILRELNPKLFYSLGGMVSSKTLENFFHSIVTDVLTQRDASNSKRNDFMDLMLEFRKQGSLINEKKFPASDDHDFDDIEITNLFIAAQAFIFFAAGYETSSGLMSFTLNELALDQDIQEKLYEEIVAVIEKHGGELTYDAIMDMQYLDMVLCETMRKYPALGAIQRVCTKAYTFPGTKVHIAPGTMITIPLRAIHYDHKYYPDPYKYIPERFNAETRQQRHPMTYMPFGEGPRNCIGLRFGKIQSSVGVISFLQRFRVVPCDRTEEQVTLHPRTFVMAAKDGIWLKIIPR